MSDEEYIELIGSCFYVIPLLVPLALAVFCALIPIVIFAIFMIIVKDACEEKRFVKLGGGRIYKENHLPEIYSCFQLLMFFVGWGLFIFFSEFLNAPISKIPFWGQIMIIFVLSAINFFMFGIAFVPYNNFPENKGGGGGGYRNSDGDSEGI